MQVLYVLSQLVALDMNSVYHIDSPNENKYYHYITQYHELFVGFLN